jgi:uncharacterized protein
MRKSRICFVALMLGLFVLPTSFADSPTSKEAKIRQLMELTGASKLGQQVMNQMLTTFQQKFPDFPPQMAEEFQRAFHADSLVSIIVPIYAKYFTDADIDGLIAFYGTETGKKLITVMPDMTREIQTISTEWGRQIGMQIGEKLKSQAEKK